MITFYCTRPTPEGISKYSRKSITFFMIFKKLTRLIDRIRLACKKTWLEIRNFLRSITPQKKELKDTYAWFSFFFKVNETEANELISAWRKNDLITKHNLSDSRVRWLTNTQQTLVYWPTHLSWTKSDPDLELKRPL